MQVAELVGPREPLRLTTREIPETPSEGFLLKTEYAGVCHSDCHFIDEDTSLGNGEFFKYSDVLGEKFAGTVLGHEFSGVVQEVGKDAPADCNLKAGDRVVVFTFIGCRQCEACAADESNLCENNKGGVTDIGQGAYAGGYSQFVAVPECCLAVKVPKSVSPVVAATMPCSMLTAYRAYISARPALQAAVRLRGMANLLVVGVGGLGMWSIIMAKSLFCEQNVRVIAADINKDKLLTATELDADDVVHWEKDADVEHLVSTTTMSGYNKMDAAIDFVGTAHTQNVAIQSLHNGGSLVSIGIHGGALTIQIPVIVSKSISILGVRVGGLCHLRDLMELVAVQNIEKHPPFELFKLEEINTALQKLREGKIKGRALITYQS